MKLFYGICGEGQGHAGRSYALIERLMREGHEVDVYTFGQSLELFKSTNFPQSKLHEILGMRFATNKAGIDLPRTAIRYFQFMLRYTPSMDRMVADARQSKPDFFITDFEPVTSWAAKKAKIPLVSIDNQHRFRTTLKGEVPWSLRMWAGTVGYLIPWWISPAELTIVSAFHQCDKMTKGHKVEIMIRDKMTEIKPSHGDHYLVYMRGGVADKVVPMLHKLDGKFIVYGSNGRHYHNVEYKTTSYDQFAIDLASCRGVITQAGHQLLGEAKYYGKKVCAIPIPRQHEQVINAWYAEKEGIGMSLPLQQVSLRTLTLFMNKTFNIRGGENGVDQVMSLLKERYGSPQEKPSP